MFDTRKEIVQRLKELPEEIHAKREEIYNIQIDIEEKTKAIKDWETKEMEEINADKTFSNADKRKAELERRRKENPEIAKLTNEVESLGKAINRMKMDLGLLVDIQENLRAICRLGGDEE